MLEPVMLRMTTSREPYQWWFFPFLFSLLGMQFQIHSFSGDPGDQCSYCTSLSLSTAPSQDQMVRGEGAQHQDPLHVGHCHPA